MTPGTRIGPYEVIAPLGEGGMGEVYRAKDTTLGREVALKILPAAVANDPERLARFDREAKALAALSHANIAQIYGLERGCIVMELAPGEDLSVRIRQGPIPIDEALPIAAQIAAALEAAHERSIVHRDLKPANVKVSDDGAVKVLDFGLAKAMAPDSSSDAIEVMNSPTFTAQATAAGVILGTAAYMSPEQARGRVADKRSDVWAFGVVLYEMLTGKQLFEGDTISDTIAAVLRQDIPFAALPAGTPREIDKLLRRCLERDRRNRIHDIADARIVIDEVMRGGSPEVTTIATSSRPPLWLLALASVVLVTLGVVGGRLSVPPAAQNDTATIRFSIRQPKDVLRQWHPAVAPDGSFIVFESESRDKSQLFVQHLNEAAPRPLPGTEDARTSFISPDGRWIAFRRSGRIEKVSVDGGNALIVANNISDSAGATWVPGGPIVFAPTWIGPLSAVSPEGGAVRQVSTLDTARGESGHVLPNALPDGHHVLMTVFSNGLTDSEIAVLDLDSGTHQVLLKGAEPSYVAPGYLVFYRAGGYHAVRFDPVTRTVSGDPALVLDDAIGNSPLGSDRNLNVAPGGTLAYVTGPFQTPRQLMLIGEGGKAEVLPFPIRSYKGASISPDRSRVIASAYEGGRLVLRMLDLDHRSDERLDLLGENWDPVWHPDGRHFWFSSFRAGNFDVYQKDANSSGAEAPVLTSNQDEEVIDFTPDGGTALVRRSTSEGQYRFHLVPLKSPQSVSVVSSDNVDAGRISRDGKYLAYISGQTSIREVYVKELAGDTAPQKIGAGDMVAWSRDGRDLLILREPEIVAIRFSTEGSRFRTLGERSWSRVEGDYSFEFFQATTDGRVFVATAKERLHREIRVVLNWQREIATKLAR